MLTQTETRIELSPFNEKEIVEYVSLTLHRSPEYVSPLVAVIQEKTMGNPFFVREMLDTCYRKKCVYYSWKVSAWVFDLDRIFSEFESQTYGSQINNDFIRKRLQELPPVTRSFLAWASLIGHTFSFSLVKAVMDHSTEAARYWRQIPAAYSQDPFAGLQGALSAYVVVPDDDDDRFRFAHDRYMQAAANLNDSYSHQEMHFVIALVMAQRGAQDPDMASHTLFERSRHVCFAVNLIKDRIERRAPHRNLLYLAAESASASGARSSGRFYYENCIKLLQERPWDDTLDDVDYQETLSLHTRAAEVYWYLGQFANATRTLKEVFDHVTDAVDKAPSWIIESRIFAVQGNSVGAIRALATCLSELGHEIPQRSWEECDAKFLEICTQLEKVDLEAVLRRPVTSDRVLLTVGAVLVEIQSAGTSPVPRIIAKRGQLTFE